MAGVEPRGGVVMVRTAILILCVFAVATLFSQAIGAAWLWSRGQLTAETWRDVRQALAGQSAAEMDSADEESSVLQSRAEVMQRRLQRILELSAREQELSVLKKMISDDGQRLIANQQKFEQLKQTFEQQMKDLNARNTSAATEQSRGILLAMPPADAVANLLPLELDENVTLLRGMPEQNIAKILQEFYRNGDKQRERGTEIFKAMTLGEPAKTLIEQTAAGLENTKSAKN